MEIKFNDYKESQEIENKVSPALDDFYKNLWGDIKIEKIADKERQIKGIDKIIHFLDGNIINIDEKIREKDWPDILLERWSDNKKKIPSWLFREGSKTDYYVYYFVPNKECWLIPAQSLKVWARNNEKKLLSYQKIIARNYYYNTESYVIPKNKLLEICPETKMYML